MIKIEYRKIERKDNKWVNEFIITYWGSDRVVVHNTIFIPGQLNGYIACSGKNKIGLITHNITGSECEIVTLNSSEENKGIGRKLVELVIAEAKKLKCNRVWVVTTNDNIRAIKFYQKLGFQLINVFPNAVNKSRKLKPEIPLMAENGIPIRDELEFSISL